METRCGAVTAPILESLCGTLSYSAPQTISTPQRQYPHPSGHWTYNVRTLYVLCPLGPSKTSTEAEDVPVDVDAMHFGSGGGEDSDTPAINVPSNAPSHSPTPPPDEQPGDEDALSDTTPASDASKKRKKTTSSWFPERVETGTKNQARIHTILHRCTCIDSYQSASVNFPWQTAPPRPFQKPINLSVCLSYSDKLLTRIQSVNSSDLNSPVGLPKHALFTDF